MRTRSRFRFFQNQNPKIGTLVLIKSLKQKFTSYSEVISKNTVPAEFFVVAQEPFSASYHF
jgi:hypothetical protein